MDIRTKHEIKTCPRCGRALECKLNNPVHCQCAGATLTPDQLQYLQEHWSDCLCIQCLSHIAAGGT